MKNLITLLLFAVASAYPWHPNKIKLVTYNVT